MPHNALLLVDVQNDFCPGGALAVPEGDKVVPVLNEYVQRFEKAGAPIYASRDWHPQVTKHFKDQGGPWPPHCLADSRGAAFHPQLKLPADVAVVTKGTDPTDDGYSAFEAKDEGGSLLGRSLKDEDTQRLFVGGLATEYCVRASVLDGLKQGLDVVVLLDAVRGIDVNDGDVARSLDEMIRAGARTATLATIDEELK